MTTMMLIINNRQNSLELSAINHKSGKNVTNPMENESINSVRFLYWLISYTLLQIIS